MRRVAVVGRIALRHTRLLSRYCAGYAGEQRKVWLTFDDGPHPIYTSKILDILGRRNIPATFFMIGERMEQFPHITRRVVEEGHGIGNHSYTHARLTTLDRSAVLSELERTHDVLARFYRAVRDFGHRSEHITELCSR